MLININQLKVAVVKNGLVISIAGIPSPSDSPDSIVIIPKGVSVSAGDLYDGKNFSVNPQAADIAATQAKKQDILNQLAAAQTSDDLKAVVAAIDADVNAVVTPVVPANP